MATRARKAAIPTELEPMEAKLVSELPTGEGWQFEPKYYRLDARPWTWPPKLSFQRSNQPDRMSTARYPKVTISQL